MELNVADGQFSLFGGDEAYADFKDKFKLKKTTDDCYTPDNVYEAVAEWVEQEYNVKRDCFVRPFWPGKDYRLMEYPPEAVVVDNPPFSIRVKIIDFYQGNGIRFFLFSPALTLLSRRNDVCHLAIGANITYENGAVVPTSFVTNLEGGCVLRTAPDLYKAVKAADEINVKAAKKELPKYIYPDYVITAAIVQRWCHYGIEYRLAPGDCVCIGKLDEQKKVRKNIFGYGYLLSERAAAERAAAERAAAERAAATKWKLSPRELEIVRKLGGGRSKRRCWNYAA